MNFYKSDNENELSETIIVKEVVEVDEVDGVGGVGGVERKYDFYRLKPQVKKLLHTKAPDGTEAPAAANADPEEEADVEPDELNRIFYEKCFTQLFNTPKSKPLFWCQERIQNKWFKPNLTGLFPTNRENVYWGCRGRYQHIILFVFKDNQECLTVYYFENYFTRNLEPLIKNL